MNMKRATNFQNIDYGTRVSTTEIHTITVKIDPNMILGDYAKATLAEMSRMNPTRYSAISKRLSGVRLHEYFTYLLSCRISYVRNESKDWRLVRQFWMPAWIQFAIACVGEVLVSESGLKFVPTMDELENFGIEDAFEISDILRSFKVDGLSVLDDGFPRTREGEKDTMSVSLIGDSIKGIWPVTHPIYTYVSGFLGFKLLESNTYAILYKLRYDDVNFIAHSLLHDERLFR